MTMVTNRHKRMKGTRLRTRTSKRLMSKRKNLIGWTVWKEIGRRMSNHTEATSATGTTNVLTLNMLDILRLYEWYIDFRFSLTSQNNTYSCLFLYDNAIL